MTEMTTLTEKQILAGLACDDPDQIRSMCFEAGDRSMVRALPLLVQQVQCENLGIQEAAEYALRRIRGAATVSAVVPLLRSESAPVRNASMDILREIGVDDIKGLCELLHDDDPDMRIFTADILGTTMSPLALAVLSEVLLSDPEVNVRYQAGISLGTLGFPAAAEALRLALKDEEWVQFAAIEALTKIRADSCVDILINALDGASPLVASTIVNALGEMDNVKAAPVLLARLEKASIPLRNKAVKAIIQILGAPSLSYLGAEALERFHIYLMDALQDEDDDIVLAALTGLAELGSEQGAEAVLVLVASLDPVKGHDLLLAALRCLSNMGFSEALAAGLTSDNEQVVACCIEACGNIGGRKCASALANTFWQINRDMQRVAATHLTAIADASFVPCALEVLSKHTDSHVIKDMLMFLGNKIRAVEVGPRLLEYLNHSHNDVKETALEACLALHDPGVNKALVQSIHDVDPIKRLMATYAMGQIDVDAYLSDLGEALEDESPEIRKVTIEAIAATGVAHPERLSLLTPRLHDENRDVRMVVVASLSVFEASLIMPLLFEALRDPDDWVRVRAVEALGRLRLQESAVALVAVINHNAVLVVLKVIEALGMIGGDVAFRALLGLAGHQDPDVQQAAATALEFIRTEQGEDI